MIKKLLIMTLVFMIVIFTIYYRDTYTFKVNTVQLSTNKIPAGSEIKVVQITDLHNKVFGDQNKKLIRAVEQLKPDIIVITGDLVDRRTDQLDDVFYLVENITTNHEDVFFVTGNHEWGNPRINELLDGLRERGVTLLNNRNSQIMKHGITFNLVGVDDVSTRHDDLGKAIEGTSHELLTILLSHSPGIVEKYDHIPADLILSGHTHGGQVRLPLVGAIVAPDQGFFPKLDKGVFEINQDQKLYIDSGLGTSILPIRFLNRSQLSLIHIANMNE